MCVKCKIPLSSSFLKKHLVMCQVIVSVLLLASILVYIAFIYYFLSLSDEDVNVKILNFI